MRLKFDRALPVIVLDAELEVEDLIGHIRMALDTGATYTMIPWQAAIALGLNPEIAEERIEILTASGTVRVPLVRLTSLSVSGKRFKDVQAVVHDLPARGLVDGLLGLNVLKDSRLILDFRQGVLEIE